MVSQVRVECPPDGVVASTYVTVPDLVQTVSSVQVSVPDELSSVTYEMTDPDGVVYEQLSQVQVDGVPQLSMDVTQVTTEPLGVVSLVQVMVSYPDGVETTSQVTVYPNELVQDTGDGRLQYETQCPSEVPVTQVTVAPDEVQITDSVRDSVVPEYPVSLTQVTVDPYGVVMVSSTTVEVYPYELVSNDSVTVPDGVDSVMVSSVEVLVYPPLVTVSTQVTQLPDGVYSVVQYTVSYPDEVGTYETVTVPDSVGYETEGGMYDEAVEGRMVSLVDYPNELLPETQVTNEPDGVLLLEMVSTEVAPDGVVSVMQVM